MSENKNQTQNPILATFRQHWFRKHIMKIFAIVALIVILATWINLGAADEGKVCLCVVNGVISSTKTLNLIMNSL
jgi:hypothetical protein